MSDVRGWEFDASGGGTYKPPPSVGGHRHVVETGDLAPNAVTTDKILDGTILVADLAAVVQDLLVPVGVISPYAGTSAPTGWLICDGTTFSAATYPALNTLLGGNTLPNLKGRVVVGLDAAQVEFDVRGETGGAKTVAIASGNLPTHTHAVDHDHASATTGGGSSHGHTVDSHNHGGGTGVHAHELPGRVRTSTTAHEHDNTAFQYASRPTGAISFTDSANPTTNSVGIGNTFDTPGTTTDTAHTHALNLPNFTGSSGDGGFAGTAHNNLQPYIAYNYIIKAA